MKKSIIQAYGHLTYQELPPEVKAEVDRDPEARLYFQNAEWLAKALSVKQFETPSEEALGRIQHRVQTRIDANDFQDTAAPRFSIASWWAGLSPVLQGAAVILFLGMLLLGASRFVPQDNGGGMIADDQTPNMIVIPGSSTVPAFHVKPVSTNEAPEKFPPTP